MCFSVCAVLACVLSWSPASSQNRRQVKPKSVKLEQQLARLAELGFKLEDRISLDDILHSFDRKQYERMNIVKEREGHRFYVKDGGQAMLLFYLDSRKVADLNRLTNNALKPVLAQVENAINDEYAVLSALLMRLT